MSQQLESPQVPALDTAQWANDLHIGFHLTQVEQVNNTFDAESPAPQKLQGRIDDYRAAARQEDGAYLVSRAAEQTAEIARLDDERDQLLSEVVTMMDAMARMASLPQQQQAAIAMRRLWDVYKPDPRAAYEAETTALQQWHDDFQADPAQVAAAQTLGLTATIQAMMDRSTRLHQLILERSQQQAGQQQAIALKDARAQTDRAYNLLKRRLNALAEVDDDPERFTAIITALTAQQDNYRELYNDRVRKNRRVSLKSDIVGNRRYATKSGWTWQRLADENPRDLTVAPDGRILSLDPKAQQAGGLAVTLDGQPVSAADEALTGKRSAMPLCSAKNYQLSPA